MRLKWESCQEGHEGIHDREGQEGLVTHHDLFCTGFEAGLCVCHISITHGSNQFIFSVEVYWEGLLCTLDFGDLDF